MNPSEYLKKVTSSISSFSTFNDLADYLNSLGMFRMQLGLGRIRSVLEALSLESPPFGVLHLVGTNGKGSASAYASAIGRAHGYSVGLYTSPHYVDFRERAVINGRMQSKDDWLRASQRVMDAGGGDLTYFEFITATAVVLFAEAKVDWAVLEAGLGGRYDATRALPAEVTLISSIDLDHTHILGSTLAEIAADKAGAIRNGQPAFSAPQDPEAGEALLRAAEAAGSKLKFVHGDDLPASMPPGMKGSHQRENAALAVAGWQEIALRHGFELESNSVAEALAYAWLPGRFQVIPGEPELILDCGHNPAAVSSVAGTLKERGIKPRAVVFTCLNDKQLDGMAHILRGVGADIFLVPELPGVSRGRSAEEVAEALGKNAVVTDNFSQALAKLPRDGTSVVCGSLYLLAEFFRLRPDYLRWRG